MLLTGEVAVFCEAQVGEGTLPAREMNSPKNVITVTGQGLYYAPYNQKLRENSEVEGQDAEWVPDSEVLQLAVGDVGEPFETPRQSDR